MSEFEKILSIQHFQDFIDVPHLINDRERLPGPDGTIGTGMKLREAIDLAASWWDLKARFSMPDFGKDPHEQIVKSCIMMGLPWVNLTKQDMLRVLAQWYAHVGIHTIIEARSTSSDKAEADNISKIRDDGKQIFKVLDTSSTHPEVNDALEVATWKEGYDEIAREETLIDTQGQPLERKTEHDKPQSHTES